MIENRFIIEDEFHREDFLIDPTVDGQDMIRLQIRDALGVVHVVVIGHILDTFDLRGGQKSFFLGEILDEDSIIRIVADFFGDDVIRTLDAGFFRLEFLTDVFLGFFLKIPRLIRLQIFAEWLEPSLDRLAGTGEFLWLVGTVEIFNSGQGHGFGDFLS